MTCTNCDKAKSIKHWPGYQADCHGCKVRALATGPAHHSAMQANAMTAGYRSALRAAFGESWMAAHEEVKAEYARMQAM